MLFLGVAAYWGPDYFRHSEENISHPERAGQFSNGNAQATAFSELSFDQQVAALKAEEMNLAQAALKDFPNHSEALAMMGYLHSRHGRRKQAMACWQQCLNLDSEQVIIHRHLGDAAMDTGNFENAIEHYEKAFKLDPSTPGLHESIGRAFVELGRYDGAIAELLQEIQVSPRSVSVHFLLGQAYFKQKQFEKARVHYQMALAIDPEYEHACYGLSRVYAALQQPEKSSEYRRQFRILKDHWADKDRAMRTGARLRTRDLAEVRKSVVLTCLGAEKLYRANRDFDRAEAILKRAIAIDPTNRMCFERLGMLYRMTHRHPEALCQFERIREMAPSDAFSHLNVGTVLTELKRYDQATRSFQKAIELAPEQSVGYRQLARLYLKAKSHLPQARRLAEKALVLEPIAVNYYVLALTAGANGDSAGALQAMDHAVNLDPANRKYRQIQERILAGEGGDDCAEF